MAISYMNRRYKTLNRELDNLRSVCLGKFIPVASPYG